MALILDLVPHIAQLLGVKVSDGLLVNVDVAIMRLVFPGLHPSNRLKESKELIIKFNKADSWGFGVLGTNRLLGAGGGWGH